uniref:Cilia- and flagella-associated protein 251-like n=1 Tax=Rhabditophanes sp. KR3021 TaxID=114890 RepID=A0AC35TKT2_9BILA
MSSRKRHNSSEEDYSDHESEKPQAKKEHKETEEQTKRCRDDAEEEAGEVSMSIEDTNKLRLKLGLAPLDMGTSKAPESTSGDPNDKVLIHEGVAVHHRPAVNLTNIKKEEKIKEKIETMQKKREVYGKVLKKTKGLADSSSDEDTSDWLQKHRVNPNK